MKIIHNLLVVCLGLFSISSFAIDSKIESGQGSENIYATYKCHNKMDYVLDVVFNNKKDTVEVTYKDETTSIPLAQSADGARYSNDKSEYWFKGSNLTINGKVKCEAIDKILN